MVTFSLILAITGFLGVLVFLTLAIFNEKYFHLYLSLLICCGILLVGGIRLNTIITSKNTASMTIKDAETAEYNYCPYCGEEIK
jgi:hypothetical protein